MSEPVTALERARDELIDLTNRSRLLNVRLEGRANQLRVERERSAAVYQRLVGDGGHFGFVAVDGSAPLREAEVTDGHLSTTLDATALERRLLRLAYDDRTMREETGVSSLHLALGFLRWVDQHAGNVARLAPLVLVPVSLERASAATPFRLRYTGDELPTNLSLQTKLRREFALELPDAPEGDSGEAGAELNAHFDAVAAAVATRPGFDLVRDEIVLGFFSFAKFLMWRDLDPSAWPSGIADRPPPDRHPIVSGLLGKALPASVPPLCGDDDPLDPIVPPERSGHVVDADSSQAQVVAEAIGRRRSLVVQGPPGTGKSQTITNVIAAAVREGLRVLFVAEKLAALSVVKSRLDAVGLGPACLELHSAKATRRGVLDDLSRTLELGPPRQAGGSEPADRLRRARERLAAHGAALHARDARTGHTLYESIGELALLESKRAFPRSYACDGIDSLDARAFSDRLADLEALAGFTRAFGLADAHPWRGSRVDDALPSDLAAIPGQAGALTDAIVSLAEVRSSLEAARLPATTFADVERGLAVVELVGRRPACDAAALRSDAWGPSLQATRALAADLERAAAERARLAATLVDRSLSPEAAAGLASARDDLAATGHAWLRFLMPRWRRAMAALRAACRSEPPAGRAERMRLLDDAIALHALERSIAERDAHGRAAFGSLWAGRATDARAVGALVRWFDELVSVGMAPDAARRAASDACAIDATAVDAHRSVATSARDLAERFLARWRLDLSQAFGSERLGEVPLAALKERSERWRDEPDRLREWLDWRVHARRLVADGLDSFVRSLASGATPHELAADDLRHARHVALVRRLDPDGRVTRTAGDELGRVSDELRGADEACIHANRPAVARAHHERIPQSAQGKGIGIGQAAIIRRECAKQRRHLPIRRLLAEAGEAVQAIKPVLMMSPLSVARFLEPGRLAFDVLVVDEASQVRPVEALGAVARLAPDATLIVVGDEMQLPPTSFFAGDTAGDDGGESESLGDLESLLGACEAAGVPRRMLRWHYRSRHHSLIEISNRAFYGERLRIVPSPGPADESLGLRMRHVERAVYDRGGSRTNAAEARAVAEAVMRHARATPELTLGVAAFSVQQRDAIVDEVEAMRRTDPTCEEFFAEAGREPFFIKNLENVQGDERDVILVSVGYGRDAAGQLTMNFGPVSATGGERRLNVLMTRAKRRCEIVTSLRAEDIDLSRTSGEGPRALREFLARAATSGAGTSLESAQGATALERSIAQALTAAGHPSDCRVGAAGTMLDVAVRDPRRAGAYLVAIETDGPHWHHARAARDRDRIRPTVLRDRGWTVTRVWAADWWLRRAREIDRLLGVIRDAMDGESAATRREPDGGARPGAVAAPAVERESARPAQAAPLTEPYREATFPVPRVTRPIDLDDRHFIEIVGKVIEVESPIHVDELAKRVASLFRLSRVSPTLAERVSFAARRLSSPEARFAAMDGDFVRLVSQAQPIPRRRDAVGSASLRDPAMIAPAELIELLCLIARAHVGASRDQLVGEARRQLGFGSTGPRLREALEGAVAQAVTRGRLAERNGLLFGA